MLGRLPASGARPGDGSQLPGAFLTGVDKCSYTSGGRGKEEACLRSLKGLEENGISLSQVSVVLTIH